MARTLVPPLKSQGIKTKMVPTIRRLVPSGHAGRWVEPFMGTGVVGLNLASGTALMADTNPHIIDFYQAVADRTITARTVRDYLSREGTLLKAHGEAHYYHVRDRFNADRDPLDFLFLSRAGFNGMMRFNRKGEFNIPFCKKPDRFARSYVTKIVNQVSAVSSRFAQSHFEFAKQEFQDTILQARSGDIIYCDPPYIGRHVDFYNGWSEADERQLFHLLSTTKAEFILSTWAGNELRANDYLTELWGGFSVLKREHFYHVGGALGNRRAMTEALVYSPGLSPQAEPEANQALTLL